MKGLRLTAVLLAVAGAVTLLSWALREDPTRSDLDTAADSSGGARGPAPVLTAPAPETHTGKRGAEAAPSPGAGDERPEEDGSAIVLHGVVVDEAGEPISKATVYVVPKELNGEQVDGLAGTSYATTDEAGRWRFVFASAPSYWLGAMAWKHFASCLDGDPIDPEAEQRLVLKRCDPLVLEIVDAEGRAVEGARVRVETRSDDPRTHSYPGPRGAVAMRIHRTVKSAERELTLYPSTRAPVVVSVRKSGHYAEPEHLLCEPPSGHFTVRLLPTCHVKIVVKDATTGAPLQQGFGWLLHRGDDQMGGATLTPGGVMDARHPWMRPGTYRLEVQSLRYRKHVSQPFSLDVPGASHSVEVALEPDLDLGDIQVRVAGLADLPDIVLPGGETRRPGVSFWWRRSDSSRWTTAPREQMLGWSVNQEGDVYSADALAPGDIDVFAYHHGSGRAGLLRNVEIPRGKLNTVTIDMRAGLFCEVPGPAKRARVRTPGGDRLPVFAAESAGMSSWGEDDPIEQDSVTLGPYPGAALVVEWIGADGETHSRRVERKSN